VKRRLVRRARTAGSGRAGQRAPAPHVTAQRVAELQPHSIPNLTAPTGPIRPRPIKWVKLVGGPHAVGPASIRVRSEAEVDIPLDWEGVDRVVLNKRVAQGKQSLVTAEQDGQRALHPCIQHETNLEVRLRLPVEPRLPRGTKTVSKIHLCVDLPQPSTDEACRPSAVVVRVSSAGRHARPRPDHEDDRRHPEQSRRDERRLPQSVAAARYLAGDRSRSTSAHRQECRQRHERTRQGHCRQSGRRSYALLALDVGRSQRNLLWLRDTTPRFPVRRARRRSRAHAGCA